MARVGLEFPESAGGAEPGDTLECRLLDLEPRLPYGSNFSANWGLLFEEFEETEHVVIFEADLRAGLARAVFPYPYPTSPLPYPGLVTPPESAARSTALEGVVIPLRLHFGTAGVAPAEDGKISTIPPTRHGGNVDNREFLIGTTMYYRSSMRDKGTSWPGPARTVVAVLVARRLSFAGAGPARDASGPTGFLDRGA